MSAAQLDRCWCWFRYLTKQLDERALYAAWARRARVSQSHSSPCAKRGRTGFRRLDPLDLSTLMHIHVPDYA
jgi:hypothetical protein